MYAGGDCGGDPWALNTLSAEPHTYIQFVTNLGGVCAGGDCCGDPWALDRLSGEPHTYLQFVTNLEGVCAGGDCSGESWALHIFLESRTHIYSS